MERNSCVTARAVAPLALPHFRLGPEGACLILTFLISIGRYLFSGQVLENFRPWVEETTGLDVTDVAPKPPPAKPAAPVRNAPFLDAVGALCKRFSDADEDRVFHAHGHTCQEVPSAARMSWPLQIWPVAERFAGVLVSAIKLRAPCLGALRRLCVLPDFHGALRVVCSRARLGGVAGLARARGGAGTTRKRARRGGHPVRRGH